MQRPMIANGRRVHRKLGRIWVRGEVLPPLTLTRTVHIAGQFGYHSMHLSAMAIATLLLWLVLVFGCTGATPQGFRQLEFSRSGGIAGLDDQLTISADGTARLRRRAIRQELDIEPDVMDRLVKTLQDVPFGDLRREYLPPRAGADLIEYMIKVDGHTVRTEDTAIPESLQPLIDLLVQIVEG